MADDQNQKSYSKVTVINNLNDDMVNNQDLDEEEDDYDLDENENEEEYELENQTDDYRWRRLSLWSTINEYINLLK